MAERLRVGVVGAGLQGQKHLACYAALPQVQIAVVADSDGERAREAADECGAERAYAGFDDMLDDAPLDAVSVVTPDDAHREPCVAAAARGKHLLVEKPLATSMQDGEAIVGAG